jgi:hypothetical protein
VLRDHGVRMHQIQVELTRGTRPLRRAR